MTPEQMLREFHAAAGLTLPASPTLDIGSEFVSDEVRQKMLDSEVKELRDAVAAGHLAEIADALADIVYVVVGTAVTYGLPFDEVFAEVHRSNMTKFLPDGPVINEDGKIVKGPGYEPPRLAPILGLCPTCRDTGRVWTPEQDGSGAYDQACPDCDTPYPGEGPVNPRPIASALGRWTLAGYDEKGFACLDEECPGCHSRALIINELNVAECLTCTWRERRACPDGGTCHHWCKGGCFRVACCGPLSGVYPDDEWPAEIRAAEEARDA